MIIRDPGNMSRVYCALKASMSFALATRTTPGSFWMHNMLT